jgi:hypothetical protein
LNLIFGRYNYNDPVKENEMGKACNTHGVEDGCIKASGAKDRNKEITRKTET